MFKNNSLAVSAAQIVPAVLPLDYIKIERAAKKLGSTLNLKCGFQKHDFEDLAQELALLMIEQSITHNSLKAQPLTRAVNTLNHKLKFKGDAFDYVNFNSMTENESDDEDDDDDQETIETEIDEPDDKPKTGLQAMESFEIRALVNGLATVKGKKLSDRRKREVIQKNVEHFKKGDLFDGEGN